MGNQETSRKCALCRGAEGSLWHCSWVKERARTRKSELEARIAAFFRPVQLGRSLIFSEKYVHPNLNEHSSFCHNIL